jgi:hypothetical protein
LKLRFFGLVSRCGLLGKSALKETPKTLEAGWRFQPLGDFLEVGLLSSLTHSHTQAMSSLPAPPFLLLLGEIAALQLTRSMPFQVQERHLDEFVPAFDTIEFATEAAIRLTIGQTYSSLGIYPEAENTCNAPWPCDRKGWGPTTRTPSAA